VGDWDVEDELTNFFEQGLPAAESFAQRVSTFGLTEQQESPESVPVLAISLGVISSGFFAQGLPPAESFAQQVSTFGLGEQQAFMAHVPVRAISLGATLSTCS